MNLTYWLASFLIERAKEQRQVAAGPFKGAQLIPSALEHDWNKLMGIYEFYLHGAIESAIASRPPLCIDVGAAEGYYTLGLAHRLPKSRHIAFEMIDETRSKLVRAARSLQASIQAKGKCTPEELTADVRSSERGFLLMDCEGYEEHLLAPSTRDPLAGWLILLELSYFQAAGTGFTIPELFAVTHDVAITNAGQSHRSTLSALALWPLNALCLHAFRAMFEEERGCTMRFFHFTPKSQA
jgi:hypothetical protein